VTQQLAVHMWSPMRGMKNASTSQSVRKLKKGTNVTKQLAVHMWSPMWGMEIASTCQSVRKLKKATVTKQLAVHMWSPLRGMENASTILCGKSDDRGVACRGTIEKSCSPNESIL